MRLHKGQWWAERQLSRVVRTWNVNLLLLMVTNFRSESLIIIVIRKEIYRWPFTQELIAKECGAGGIFAS